jgi:hypothetical protein
MKMEPSGTRADSYSDLYADRLPFLNNILMAYFGHPYDALYEQVETQEKLRRATRKVPELYRSWQKGRDGF